MLSIHPFLYLCIVIFTLAACESIDMITTAPDAGMVAGTPAGMVAGTPAGMVAGTPAGMVAGTEGGFSAGDEGAIMVPTCNTSISIGEVCQVDNDCCSNGSVCVANIEGSNEGICYRECDDNSAPNGCQARELCIPAQQGVPAGQPSPGFCLPGDGCEPGNENETCGEGTFGCVRIQNITLCQDLSNLAPESIVDIGERCDNQTTTCRPGLVCEYGVCRATCNGICGAGSECLDYTERTEGINYRFCMDPCDVYGQDCANNEACVLVDTNGDAALGECLAGTANGTVAVGASCTTSEQHYWGSCEANSFCIAEEENSPIGSCVSLCDSANLDQCGQNTACITNIFGSALESLGLCFGECDPFANNQNGGSYSNASCGAGEACNFVNVGATTTSSETAIGVCQAFANSGSAGQGGACTITNEQTGENNCPPNMICTQVTQGGTNVCVKFCQEGNAAAAATCDEGYTCRTGIISNFTSIGLCL